MRDVGAHLSIAWLLGPACLLLLLYPSLVHPNPDAKRLYDDLLSNYNRLIRPVANNTDKITVKMGLKLSQLVDLVSSNEQKNLYHHFTFPPPFRFHRYKILNSDTAGDQRHVFTK